MKNFIFGLWVCITLFFIGTYAFLDINFTRECGGRLERAAYANTIPLAKEELKNALDFIERKKMTSGYTSIIYTTPDEDVGFWYANIKSAYEELNSVPESTSLLEKTNILMKLRESLLLHNSKGSGTVAIPEGISRFPNNGVFAFIGIFLFIFGIISFVRLKQD